MKERKRGRQTELGNSAVRMGMCVYVYMCVCPVLIQSIECGPPSQGPWLPKPVSFCPLCFSSTSLDVLSTGGASLPGPCPGTGLIFEARGETLLLLKSPCPGCKGKIWLQDPVPSGIGATHQDILTSYPMEEGEIGNGKEAWRLPG
ncbi:hypothetical protein HJG60_009012 [Phyllostomus discolor]|uniref:Uncharacterized protein n=1 Tax=Phyllostomus discolor TaxID=89673 RepID=A0A834DFN3_9CHIR|nr:hypothetical protein HJG60_009012 [Phyllostomus discolor]